MATKKVATSFNSFLDEAKKRDGSATPAKFGAKIFYSKCVFFFRRRHCRRKIIFFASETNSNKLSTSRFPDAPSHPSKVLGQWFSLEDPDPELGQHKIRTTTTSRIWWNPWAFLKTQTKMIKIPPLMRHTKELSRYRRDITMGTVALNTNKINHIKKTKYYIFKNQWSRLFATK